MASLKVPESVRKAAKKGLEMRRAAPKSQKGGITRREASKQGIGSGIQRASNLMRGSVSEATIPRMVSFFARHNKSIQKGRANPSENRRIRIADLLWEVLLVKDGQILNGTKSRGKEKSPKKDESWRNKINF